MLTEAGMLAERMSVNIETLTSDSLKLLAPQKNKEALRGPMYFIKERILEERKTAAFWLLRNSYLRSEHPADSKSPVI